MFEGARYNLKDKGEFQVPACSPPNAAHEGKRRTQTDAAPP